MFRRNVVFMMNIMLAVMLLSSCGSYKPPYQRGYDEGYQAGYTVAGGDAAQMPEHQSEENVSDPGEKSPVQSILSVKEDTKQQDEAVQETETNDAAEDAGADTNTDTGAEDDTGDAPEEAVETAEAEASSDSGAEVLGDGSEPAESGGGPAGIPDGRVISAEAVNEALYSHPEVIDGLRDLYTDTAIFGEYVGDSETNLLHKVNGPHLAELTYNTIVVFDGSKSIDDILNEGFFTKCSCCDQ